ncbi:MAG: hypothetical protein A2041_01080 [Bacteroidetes bacterium GWA2_31_9b]|nr:MAG: hypothetical protein A2041_01080 [Bacteroidetes bacterium GWA2_31_9b]
MKKSIILILLFGILGLVAGYFLFGKIGGEYVNIKTIFSTSSNAIESLGRKIAGIEKIKQNILISGGVGGLVGLIIGLRKK